MRFALALVIVVPSLLSALATDHGTAPGAQVEWWGPTDADNGYHLRVSVTISNPSSLALDNPAVRLDLDVAKLLAQAGWPTIGSGRLSSFELDKDSIRVVAVTNHNPPGGGTIDGRLRDYDPSQPGIDRHVAPSVVVPGLLDEPGEFNARTNPGVTLFWKIQGEMAPNAERHFMVYFDSTRNPGHDRAAPSGIEAAAAQNIHGPGPARLFYGLAPEAGSGDDNPTVTIVALHEKTRVHVDVRQGSYQPHGSPIDLDDALDQQTITVGGSQDTAFRLRSDDGRPFIAYMEPQGFVPSLEGGFAGRQFIFEAAQESVYFTDAGNGAPTTIQVRYLDGSHAAEFHLNDDDGDNPFPYTRCDPNQPMTAGGSYMATVQNGGPVLLQLVDQGPMMPVPSRQGGPTGQQFHAGLATDSDCGERPSERDWIAMGTSSGQIRVTSPERKFAIDPPGTPSNPMPSHSLPEAPERTGVFSRHDDVLNRPLGFEAEDTTAWLWLGDSGRSTRLGGPLLGEDGMRFAGVGEASVFAFYDNTRIDITRRHLDSPDSEETAFLSAGETRGVINTETDRLDSFFIEASRPVAIYPHGTRAGMLAGIQEVSALDVEIAGPAQFRGHLLGLGAQPGEPLTKSTVPGVPVTFTLLVQNVGRNADGSTLEDKVDLQATVTEGWTAELDTRRIHLGSSEPQRVQLTVTPPSDAEPGSQSSATVTATSDGNPAITVSANAFTRINRAFDVALWFTDQGELGPNIRTQTPGEDEPTEFNVTVKNKGSVEDTIDLHVTPDKDWGILLLREGKEIEDVTLAADEELDLKLRVTPPAGAKDARLKTVVTATSEKSPAAFDTITAVAKVQAPSDVHAKLLTSSKLVLPGEEGIFEILVENKGDGPAELSLEVQPDAPPSWELPQFYLPHPIKGVQIVESITIQSHTSLTFRFSVPVPENATAGNQGTFRIAGREPDGATAFEVFPAVAVAPDHNVSVEAPEITVGLAGQPVNFDAVLENHGNLDEELRFEPGPLPQGWSLTAPEFMVLARNESVAFPFSLQPPPGAAPGEHELHLQLVSRDGHIQEYVVVAIVPSGADPSVEDTGAIPVQPGRQAVALLPVRNHANVPVTLHLESAESEWDLVSGDPIDMRPRENRTIAVAWEVPRDASDGPSTQSARLAFRSDQLDSPVFRDVNVEFDVGRPNVQVADQEVIRTAGGTLVRLSLENVGDREAIDLEVELRGDDEPRDRVRVGLLPPGEDAQVSLLDATGGKGLQVVIDPDRNMVAAGDESVLELDGEDKESPGVHVIALFALLGGAAFCQRIGGSRNRRQR